MGYEAVGTDYYGLAELGRASEYYAKAFELREHASEREKLTITAGYYETVTGELVKRYKPISSGLRATRETTGHISIWAMCTANRGSRRRRRMHIAKAFASPPIMSPHTLICPTACFPCSASRRRGT